MMFTDVRLTPFFTAASSHPGFLHSKFRHTVNFLFPSAEGHRRLLTIMKKELPAVPDSLSVSDDLFSRIHRLPLNAAIMAEEQQFHIPAASLDFKPSFNAADRCRLVIENNEIAEIKLPNLRTFVDAYQLFMTKRSYQCGFTAHQNEKTREMTAALATVPQLLLTRQTAKLKSVLAGLVGMGQGLTPAFDDALVAILAVMAGAKIYAARRPALIHDDQRGWIDFPDIILPPDWERLIECRTTDVSAKYLYCAHDGFYSDPMVLLITKLFSDQPQNWLPTLEMFAGIGGSSGYDMLYGASLAARSLNPFCF